MFEILESASPDDNEGEDEMDGNVIDLEGQSLNIVQIPDGVDIKTLILDNNNISKLENLDKCTELSQVRRLNALYQYMFGYLIK